MTARFRKLNVMSRCPVIRTKSVTSLYNRGSHAPSKRCTAPTDTVCLNSTQQRMRCVIRPAYKCVIMLLFIEKSVHKFMQLNYFAGADLLVSHVTGSEPGQPRLYGKCCIIS